MEEPVTKEQEQLRESETEEHKDPEDVGGAQEQSKKGEIEEAEEQKLPEDEPSEKKDEYEVAPAEEEVETEAAKKPPTPKPLLKVVLLDGNDLDVDLKKKKRRKATTETVVDPAHRETQTLETDFFSVFFYDNYEREHKGQKYHLKQKIFLVPGKQLRSQFSSKEKAALTDPWEYYYGVKFYVPDPNNSKLLKDEHSKFLYCLQLCDDIRANRIHVDRETAIRLTALMLQGKLGDYEDGDFQPGYYMQYPQFQLLPDSLKPNNYEAQLIEVHKAKAGYTPAQADAEFLSIAKDLSRYGEHLYLAKSMRNEEHEDCRMVTIGCGCRGISIYYEGKDDKDRTRVPWRDIDKISYKRDKFRIIYHPPENENSDETNGKRPSIKMKFYTGQRPQSKRIWKTAVEQHVFFHLDSTKTPTIVTNFFMRSSMRYSFKKTLPSSKNNPKPIDDQKDRPRGVTPRDLPTGEEGEDWVILPYPPNYNPDASKQQEHQQVQVNFTAPDREPDAHRFIICRDRAGSYEVLDSLPPEEKKTEQSFRLSMVDENSKAATVSVSLRVDPPSGVVLTTGAHESKGIPVFDSDRMPVVHLGSASVVTTATVIEQDGNRLSTGEHCQKYPLEEVNEVQLEEVEEVAGPAADDAEQAEQVKQFLQKEHEVFQNIENDPNVEIVVT